MLESATTQSPALPAPASRNRTAFEISPTAAVQIGQPLLIDVMSPAQRWQFRLLMIAWWAGLLVFYAWWFRLEHVATWLGFVGNTLLVSYSLALPAYFFFFVSRMKRVNPALSLPPQWRVAMITTRAPSEPFALVQRTLEAMLAQQFPHDTWLADEAPTEEIYRWCGS